MKNMAWQLVKSWSWKRAIPWVAWALVVVGAAPLGYMTWVTHAHNLVPLSVPLPHLRGDYTMPGFTTDLGGDYAIAVLSKTSRHSRTAPCDEGGDSPDCPTFDPTSIDWSIVDDAGASIQSGQYRESRYERTDGFGIGVYRAKKGQHVRLFLRVNKDIYGYGSPPTLEVVSDAGYDPETWAFFIAFAVLGVSPGVAILLLLGIDYVRAAVRRTAPPAGEPGEQ